jgi:hypothetical protein
MITLSGEKFLYYNNNHRTFRVIILLILFGISGTTTYAQYGGTAGAFSRMGFGARGLAMGNAMTAIVGGEISPYYNPALAAFQTDHVFTAAYSMMSLDRSLNFVQYCQHLKGTAGIAVGIINSGVSKIDGRNIDGQPTGDLSTSENLFFGAFANNFSDLLTLGAMFKYYHYQLYENISTYSAGVDFGCIITLDGKTRIGLTVSDLGVKYRWDTSKLYGDQGSATIDEFPTIIKIGVARTFVDSTLTASIDYAASSNSTQQLRCGVEWNPLENFSLRAGCDRIDLQDRSSGAMPTFGFAAGYPIGNWRPTIHYAYGIEPFSPTGIHIISVTVGF